MDYSGAYEGEMVTILRERKPPSLAEMMSVVIELEVNVLSSRKHKQEERRSREENQPSTSTSTEAKLYMMMKTMKLMFERMFFENKHPPRDHIEPQIRNLNFKRLPVQQNRLRDNINHDDNTQAIRTPFAENYVAGGSEEGTLDEILCVNPEEPVAYLTREEYDNMVVQPFEN